MSDRKEFDLRWKAAEAADLAEEVEDMVKLLRSRLTEAEGLLREVEKLAVATRHAGVVGIPEAVYARIQKFNEGKG